MKIKKGDQVLIISGKDKGKKGKIMQVRPEDGKILVEGVNIRKKHNRPKKSGEKGQIISSEYYISSANVQFVCTKCGKPTRIGYNLTKDKKYRVCKKCGGEI
jgi:large subunit ribosomal protein L24